MLLLPDAGSLMLSVHRYWWDLPQSERDAYLENSSAAATRLDAEDVAHCADAEDAQAIEIDHPTADLFRYSMLAHSLVALISEAHVGRYRCNGGMAVVSRTGYVCYSVALKARRWQKGD